MEGIDLNSDFVISVQDTYLAVTITGNIVEDSMLGILDLNNLESNFFTSLVKENFKVLIKPGFQLFTLNDPSSFF